MRALRLLLAKDLRILSRSPLLLIALIAYPLVLSGLVATVLDRSTSRPRVAFVDEDSLPATIKVGSRSFDVRDAIARSSDDVEVVPMERAEAERALERGDVAAMMVVPKGFESQLRSLLVSPELEVVTAGGASRQRVLREAESLVYGLNSRLQGEFVRQNVDYLRILVRGGKVDFLGREFDIVGLQRSAQLLQDAQGQLGEDSPISAPLAEIQRFARQATLALGQAEGSLEATAHPIELAERSASGRSSLLGSQVQSFVLAVSLLLSGLLLAAGAFALEREEGTLGRLARGLAPAWSLVGAKIALTAVCALVLGGVLALALALAGTIAGGGGAPWGRLPLLIPALLASGAAIGAVGTLIGAAAPDLRVASIGALAVALPFALLGIVPPELAPALSKLSAIFPFRASADAFGAVLFDAAPAGDLGRYLLHLGILALLYGLAARAVVGRAFVARS